MPSLSVASSDNKPYYLPVLLLISIASHFPFVLKGFGEIDATKIAVSVIDMLNNGPDAAFANYYFSDVIPLYVLYLKWFMKLLNYNYSYLPVVMNYTNAVFGTLTVIPAFFFIRQLFSNSSIAFCTVLALIFAPSYYQSTIMGFPHMIALFFLLLSLNCYLSGLESLQKSLVYSMMFLSCIFLTTAFLFKSDYVLGSGVYIGILIMRKIRDKEKITGALLIVLVSGLLFLLFRNLILGSTGGTTMSKEALSKWYNYSLIIPSTIGYFIAQAKPVAYGAGIATFGLGGLVFIYYLLRRRLDISAFITSWAALPIIFWLVMIGNNSRHNMIAVLPLLAIIVFFFHEKTPRYALILTGMLILANYFITAPSSSIIRPSGNLFGSNALLKDRMNKFHAGAEEIMNIKDDKIAVLGTFHNPHVVFEIMRTSASYKAAKIGREHFRVQVNGKEYVFIYFVVIKPEDMEEGIDYVLKEYHLQNHTFVSTMYDLQPFNARGLKTRTVTTIEKSAL